MVYSQARISDDKRSLGKLFVAATAATVLALSLFANAFAATITTSVVTESHRVGWQLNPDPTTASPYEFTNDAASLGGGSLFAKPIQNDAPNIGGTPGSYDKFIALLPVQYDKAAFSSVSFDFRLGSGVDVARADQVYLNIYTNLPGSSTYYDCRFDQAAIVGSTSSFHAVTFDSAVAPTTVASRGGATCPATLSGLAPGSVVKAVALNLGDKSTSDQDVSAYFDNVVINTGENSVVYDFEKNLPTADDKDQCKNNGWKDVARENGSSFKNQGQCVAYVVASEKASFRREL